MRKLCFSLSAIFVALAFCATPGFAQAKPAKDTTFSGYHKDYSKLKKSRIENKPLYGYEKPNANWAGYDKIQLEPVVIFRAEKPP